MIARDKQLHFISGAGLALFTGLLFGWGWGLGLAVAAGLAKETKDQIVYGGFDVYDLLATSLGGVIGTLIVVIWS